MTRQLFIIVLFFIAHTGFSQLVPEGIINAFEKGNARELSQFFHDNLEIKLLDKEYVTSKNQASRIIQKFFEEYPPISFKLDFEGTKQDSKYSLGTLKSQKASFRVNLYFMEGKKDKIIYFLSIEKI